MTLGLLTASVAVFYGWIGADAESVPGPGPLPILDGTVAENCAWPNVVALTDYDDNLGCSATLVHPLIVVTAAHCVTDYEVARVKFGEGPDNLRELADVEYCRANPAFPDGPDASTFDNRDFAFCKLATPVDNVPIIPIAFGCELDELVEGMPMAEVGFGRDEEGVSGIKRFVQASFLYFEPDGEIHNDRGSCFGDSGGPSLIQVADGTWRQVGIHSWVIYTADYDCTSSWSTAAWQVLPFIEEETGIDVTPCHDASGEWDPSFACQAVPLEPYVGGEGNYVDGCPPGELSGFTKTCGDPLDADPDDAAPTVSFVSPHNGAELDGATNVEIEIAADDAGWGVASVELTIETVDGESMGATREFAPWRWNAELPRGEYYLGASALDFAEHRSDELWIAVGVGVPAPPPRPEEPMATAGSESGAPAESSGGSSDGGDADSTAASEDTGETAMPDAQGEANGCGCRTAPTFAPAWLLLLLGVRRRARTDSPLV